MQNPKLKDKKLGKIEFLVPMEDKITFRLLCQQKSLGMAEVMKRAFEEQMRILKDK